MCAASNKIRTHPKPDSKGTNKLLTSSSHSDCHCPMNSVKHKIWNTKRSTSTTTQDSYKKKVCHQLNGFIYLYSVLCILCMVTSSVSLENIIIEDQLTQVGHFFFYNISTNASLLKDSFQLKVCITFTYIECVIASVFMCCVLHIRTYVLTMIYIQNSTLKL